MNYLHKYVVDGKNFYLISDQQSKPTGTFVLKQEDWKGKALQKNRMTIGLLESLEFSRKEIPKEEKKAAIVEQLDSIASHIESEGRPDIAVALDRITDLFEGRS